VCRKGCGEWGRGGRVHALNDRVACWLADVHVSESIPARDFGTRLTLPRKRFYRVHSFMLVLCNVHTIQRLPLHMHVARCSVGRVSTPRANVASSLCSGATASEPAQLLNRSVRYENHVKLPSETD
jgi:hypothetical protein